MTRRICYYCGGPSSGPDDHVPPEVFFRGLSGRNYKTPDIITVPSCDSHNAKFSADDESLAWIIAHAGALRSAVGMDVVQALMQPIADRAWKDREFVDVRLSLVGTRLLRDRSEYDEDGRPKQIVYDSGYVTKAESEIRERWAMVKRTLQKIAAGIYFHASRGRALGASRIASLEVVVPDFKQVREVVTLGDLTIDEASYFANFLPARKASPWVDISSGSPDVFRCQVALPSRNSARFAMKMCFYDGIRVWVTSAA